MSCFIVDAEHINVLVEAATGAMTYGTGGLYLAIDDTNERFCLTREDRDRIGQMLTDWNTASVNERYDEDDRYAYRYQSPQERWEPVEILKAIACYEYQTCEASNWENSPARAFCDALRRLCIHHLPGYEEAPWEITRATMNEQA